MHNDGVPESDCSFLGPPLLLKYQKYYLFKILHVFITSGKSASVHNGSLTGYACTLCHPRKNSRHCPVYGVFLSARARCVQPCRWRPAHRQDDAIEGHGVLGMEPMVAKTLGGRVNHTASPGLCSGSEVDQHGFRGPTVPLARELVRYTVAGGLASVVDVGMLLVLTQGLGVYYLHAAALAFGFGLLASYLLSIGWVFQARTWQNPWVEGGLFTLIGGMGLLWCGVCMWFLTEYAHLHYLCSKVVSALVVFLWNFLAKKWLLFHQ
jgi:putative flippase GtrA